MAERARRTAGTATEAGFTLLELMIALTLLALIVAMTSGVLATALDSVPRGEAVAAQSARLRAATGVMAKQVRSIVNYPARSEEDEFYPFFEGDAYSFSFITAAPQNRGGEGLGWVTYWTDGRTLWMGERLIFSIEAVSGTAPDPSSQTMLLEGLAGARFQYLRLEGTEGEWRDQWSGLEEQALPAAIRITLAGIQGGKTYWVEEIPVMTVVYGLGAYDAETAIMDHGNRDGDGDGGPGEEE
jgi:general secretion pathway protein J